MRALNVRQGVIGGLVISVVAAATSAARSDDPLPTFAYVLAVCLLATALTIVALVAINRRA
jgi:hypothetical protein